MAESPPTERPPKPRRRRIRALSLAVLGLALATAVMLQSEWFSQRVAAAVRKEIASATGLDVRLGRVAFSFWEFAVRVEGIDVVRPGAVPLAHVDVLTVAPTPQDLLRGRVHLSRVSVRGGEVNLRFEPRGDRVELVNGPVSRGGGGGSSGDPPFRDIDVTDLRVRVHHPEVGDVTLDSVDVDVLQTPNRRFMFGLLVSGGEVRGPWFTGPVRRFEARASLDRASGDVRVALAHVAVGRFAVQVREGTFSPRTHRATLDARVEGHVEDVLDALPMAHPDLDGTVAVDVTAEGDVAAQDFRAQATVDVQGLGLNDWDTDTGETYRFNLGDRVHLRAEVNRDRLVAREFRAEWAGAVITSPAVTLGLRGPMALEGDLHVAGMNFTRLMKEVTITPHTIVLWTLDGDLHLRGALAPLLLNFDIPGLDATDFAVLQDGWDRGPQRAVVRVPRARVSGRMVIDPVAISWLDMVTTFGRSRATVEQVRVRTSRDRTGREPDVDIRGIASDHIDLDELGTVTDIPIGGVAQVRAAVRGRFEEGPVVTGTVRMENLRFNTFPLGTLETAPGTNWTLRGLRLEAPRIVARHRRSAYEVADAYLDFERWKLTAGARVRSERFHVRDLYDMFHFDGDPVFEPYDGAGRVDARVDYVLGRPGDDRDGVMTLDARVDRGEAVAFGERIDDVSAHVAYEWFRRREGVRGARVNVEYFRGTKGGAPIEASGGMDPGARMHFVASARGVPLGSMDLLRDAEAPVSGSATASVSVEGTPDAPRVLASVSLRELTALGRSLGAVDLRVSQTPAGPPIRNPTDPPPPGRITLDTRLLDDRVRLHASLLVPWEAASWRDALGVTHPDHSRAWGRAELSGTLATSGEVDVLPWLPPTVLARVGADASARARFTAVVERARLDDVTRADARVVIDSLDAGAWGLTGRLGAGAPVVVCARAGAFWLAPPAQRDGCGETPARLTASAPLSVAPGADFDLARPLLIGPGGVRLWLDGGGVVGERPGEPPRVFGSVRGELDLARAAQLVPSIAWGRGLGVLEANVAWDGERPNLSGSVQMRDAAVGLASLPAPVSDVDLDVRFRGSEVVLETARASYGSASVVASGGRIRLERSGVERVDVPVRVRNLVLTARDGLPDGVEVGADADLDISRGAEGDAALLSGDVTVTRGRFTRPVYMSFDFAGRVSGEGAQGGARGGAAPQAPYDPAGDWLRFDVRVNMPAPFRVANNLIDADIRFGSGRPFSVVGTNQRYGVLGTLEIPRGVMHLNETDFEIRRGRVDFDNPERIAPTFDLLAQTDIRRTADAAVRSQWRVNLHAYGSTERVSLDWSAEPSLSLEDILLLLFFRLTRAELERVGGANAAQAVGIEVASRGIGLDRLVQRVLPFVDEVRPGSTYNFRSGIIEPSLSLGGRVTDWLRWGGMTTFSSQPLVHGTLDFRLGSRVGVQVFLNNTTNQPSTQLPNAGVDVRWRLVQ